MIGSMRAGAADAVGALETMTKTLPASARVP